MLARVVIHVLACVVIHMLAPFSTVLARVVIHLLAHVVTNVLARVLLHVLAGARRGYDSQYHAHVFFEKDKVSVLLF